MFSNFWLGPVSEKLSTHGWKEHIIISKVAKFESELLKTNKDM